MCIRLDIRDVSELETYASVLQIGTQFQPDAHLQSSSSIE